MHFGGSTIQLPGIQVLRFLFVCRPLTRGHSQVFLRSLLRYAAPSIFKANKENLPLTIQYSLTRKSLTRFKDSPHQVCVAHGQSPYFIRFGTFITSANSLTAVHRLVIDKLNGKAVCTSGVRNPRGHLGIWTACVREVFWLYL